ncbi:MAG TPA: hypothetical protein ENJ46_00390 [Hellea balneolensis]|uniref:Uncharacterized protein n=1 Tax=Hellea balneolensis TaxID=287478 RepID=A0A7C3G7K2_9PROT|nr:hypothetical protein [Hellea balneolensis]
MADIEGEPKAHKLDEVMLAMDVVDTLRQERELLAHDLSAPDREEKLLKRLREIYAGQGIEVPDDVLREGVKALDDHRFAYTPQKPSFLSKAYINRGRWGKPFLVLLGIIGFAWAVNYAAFEAPKNLQAKKVERALSVDLPKSLQDAKVSALASAKTAKIKEQITALYGDGMAAVKAKDVDAARQIESRLTQLDADLQKRYTIRVVYGPNENSGIIRGHDNDAKISNYYLIVEAIDTSGKAVSVSINSEEDQKTKRVKKWGVRVPQVVFNRVAADKRDDQIIQNAVIGQKKRGYLEPDYSVETSGGLIVEW